MSDQKPERRPTIIYDGECRLCRAVVRDRAGLLGRCGFDVRPLQDPEAERLTGLGREELLRRAHVVAADGSITGGPDAVREVLGSVRWLRPLVALSRAPLVRGAADAAYRFVAARRRR